MDELKEQIQAAIGRLVAQIQRTFERKGKDHRVAPRAPATEAEIAAYEAELAMPLPPSYRAFLELHNGYDHLGVYGHFFSIAEVRAGGSEYERIVEWKEECAENGQGFVLDGIVIGTSDDDQHYLYLDPDAKAEDGELGLVWYMPDNQTAYGNLTEYFDRQTASLGRLLDRDD